MKVRVNLSFPDNHPISQLDKKKRAATIHRIISDWYSWGERLQRIEDSLARIENRLEGGTPSPTNKDVDHERMKDQLMMDILNLK